MQTAAPESDRRPIRSRELPIFKAISARLVTLRVSADAISIAGMLCGIAAGASLMATRGAGEPGVRIYWLAAAALIQMRLLANMLDGMVAIASGTSSRLGELFNEVPDRVSDIAIIVGLGYAAGGGVEFGYIAALVAVLTAYIRAMGKAAGAGSDFRGPMAKQERMFLITAVAIYEACAPASWKPAWGDSYGLGAAALVVIIAGGLVTCIRRLHWIATRLRSSTA